MVIDDQNPKMHLAGLENKAMSRYNIKITEILPEKLPNISMYN